MTTIERLRELHKRAEEVGRTGTTSDWVDVHIELRNALPALLAVVEAQAAEIAAWRAKDGWGESFDDLYARCDTTDAALRALEGGD